MTGQSKEKQQKPAKKDEPGTEPPCQRNGTVVPPSPSFGFAIFLFKASSSVFAGGRSGFAWGFSLAISRIVQFRFQPIKTPLRRLDQDCIELILSSSTWISSSSLQFMSLLLLFLSISCLVHVVDFVNLVHMFGFDLI